jgi:hypothetical protein
MFLSETWPEWVSAGSVHVSHSAAVLLGIGLGPVLLGEQMARLSGITATVPLPLRLGLAALRCLRGSRRVRHHRKRPRAPNCVGGGMTMTELIWTRSQRKAFVCRRALNGVDDRRLIS